MADTRTTLPRRENPHAVPPFVGWMITALMVGSLSIAAWSQWGPGGGVPARQPVAEVLEERAIVLTINRAGTVTVANPDGSEIAVLAADEAGFIGSMARVVDRERIKAGLTQTPPLIVSRHADDTIRVTDPATNWSANLNGFGADNAKAFARLLAQ